MSWLYSLVFAGLLLSTQNSPTRVAATSNSAGPTVSTVRDETDRFEQTYPLTPNGRVSVSNVNGSIVVNAWDKNEVKLIAIKTADSKERLADVEIKIDAKPDSLSVETNYDSWKNHNDGDRWRNGKLQVDYELSVPRGAVLNEIETVNGSVTVADFSNVTKISAVNGNVKATNLRGRANLSTVNGEVFANFDQLDSASKINLDTVNGKVSLSIPSDSNATLRADSVNGSITNEFGLPVRKGKYVGRDLYGKVGSGEVQIKLSSVNGGLSIGRNKDGKTASPATNLLQQKNKDDDDDMDDNDNDSDKDDDDDSIAVDSVKIKKDVEKAMKQASKGSAEAMKAAQKSIAKIQPKIKIDAEAIRKATAIDTAQIQSDIQAGVQAAVQIPVDVLVGLRDIRFSNVPKIEKKSNSIPVKGVPKVTINAPGCSVKVHGWDKSEVQYSVVQFTTDRRNGGKAVAKEDHSDSTVNITVEHGEKDALPGWDGNDIPRTRIEVYVPKKSDLKITADGEIRLENVSGEINLTGNQESIDVRDGDGKISLKTSCGQVRVIGFNGQLDAKTENGNVYLEGRFDKLSATAGDGNVVLTLPQDANATIIANTDVEAEGLKIAKEKEDVWQLGKGGPSYNFDFDGGHLTVRNASEILTN